MANSHTFGVELYVYDTAAAAYLPVGDVTSLSAPSIAAGTPIDVTNHTSTSGFREFIPNPLKEITEMTCEFATDQTDAGQTYVRAHIGEIVKFKIQYPDLPVLAINAIVVSVMSADYDLDSASRQTVTLKPTGPTVAP